MVTVAPRTGETIAVGATSAAFAMSLASGKKYRLVSSTACYFNCAVGVSAATAGAQTPSATASVYLPANTYHDLDGVDGGRVSIIRSAADGFATLAVLTWH